MRRDLIGKNIGFTLAEVLIVLGIIGFVAALTIPTLMQKVQERETVTKLKKAYSTFANAYNMVVNENGEISGWNDENLTTEKELAEKYLSLFKPYLKFNKICNSQRGCLPDTIYNSIDGKDQVNRERTVDYTKFMLADGSSDFIYAHVTPILLSNYKLYGTIIIDVNGFEKPNQIGFDTFTLLITDKGILPYGAKTVGGFPEDCNKKNCTGQCEGCAAWVIYNENMDYLHCDDLSWDGKSKCN